MAAPIFFDPTGRRSRRSKRTLAVALLATLVAAVAFATTLLALAPGRSLALPLPRFAPAALLASPVKASKGALPWLPRALAPAHAGALSVGFYVPGDDPGMASLRAHAAALDWVVPALVNVAGPAHTVTVEPDVALERTLAAMPRPPKILPMVQNFGNAEWDGAGAAALLRSPPQRQALAGSLARLVAQRRAAGLVMDFEALPARAQASYLAFLRELRRAMPAGTILAVTVPAEDADWPLAAYARVADKVIFMAYDQHWEGGSAGPIAGQDWFVTQVEQGLKALGREKMIVALGSYAYDWHGDDTDALSIEEAWLAAHDSSATIGFDPASGNAGFSYAEDGARHSVWMLDAATSWNELQALKRLGLGDIALWRLGSEDPGFWPSLAAFRGGGAPDLSHPRSLLNTDVEGAGEILRITAVPTVGARALTTDAQGVVRDERYAALPTPYVVQRVGGANPRLLALTFDDGPDPTWTPRILDELEAARVPATFFVIGENALQHPGLLGRELALGGEIGNHTYTHPNLATTGRETTRLELNATQRLVEAYTGRAMTLFRAPYFGDAEPTAADELDPALLAQQAGYTVVGLHVDPNDWQRPGADAIVARVVAQVRAATAENTGNIILLHDGGGDRAQTVAALPRIIATLQAQGYRFVRVSQLVGLPPASAMPAVPPGELWAVRTDVAVFVALGIGLAVLSWLFYIAIMLGVARALTMVGLAWWQSRARHKPPVFAPSVSVIIPAFNEERVIEASVRRVLASDYPGLEVLVADDGSRDRTGAIVRKAFGDEPRVTLLSLANGGKAKALNQALQQVRGEVIIALDADTQFEPQTIRRLARWFAEPRLGAVAGDARVGNRVNLVTRWQAVEYITAQNLERRALAGFDAMTVVPGAVGAWRRAALDAVGGYPENTLAEDQDLTIAVQRAGWRVTYDPGAIAWTEAPESFRALAKQRYRWAFGTLQCLWKHRAILRARKPSGLALVGLPQAWLFQIFFAAVSPLIDLALVVSLIGTGLQIAEHGWAQTDGTTGLMALYWLAFTSIDVACGWVAYRLDGHRARYPAHLLVAQRLVYRQIMYWVVLRALGAAVAGRVVGWGKLERSGRVAAGSGPAA